MIDLLSIKDPSFIKDLSIKELNELCSEIRKFLIENISKTGGHLSSNLGVVELTVAMHYVFDMSNYDFLFDVGHQSYVHKILTGIAKDFVNLRKFHGLAPFVSREESKYDIWESGHSSTTISAASGLAISGDKTPVVLIGDLSIQSGVAFEGINYLGQNNCKKFPIIILNDNDMGISKSVGSFRNAFTKLRSTKLNRGLKSFNQKVLPNGLHSALHKCKRGIKRLIKRENLFEELGFDYYGPYKGHNIKLLIKLFKRSKNTKRPLVIHILTKKGMGYKYCEEDEEGIYHSVAPFDIATGKQTVDNNKISYSNVISNYLFEKRKNHEFFVITQAMKLGSALTDFANNYNESFIDVGIQEEHAAVMAAGIALNKKDVVLLMYSTFSQRAYDELLNDISRQDLKVIIGLDRSGIVFEDGVTHQGIYDVSMMMHMPNIIITMPKDFKEAIGLFNYAFNQTHPFVIRYPKLKDLKQKLDNNYICDLNWEILNEGKKGIIISYGPDVLRINNVILENKLDLMVINARSLKPIDINMLNTLFKKNKDILVVEQVVSNGTLYDKILEYKEDNDFTKSKIYKHSFTPDTLITHGKINDVYEAYGFSDSKLLEKIKEVFK